MEGKDVIILNDVKIQHLIFFSCFSKNVRGGGGGGQCDSASESTESVCFVRRC